VTGVITGQRDTIRRPSAINHPVKVARNIAITEDEVALPRRAPSVPFSDDVLMFTVWGRRVATGYNYEEQTRCWAFFAFFFEMTYQKVVKSHEKVSGLLNVYRPRNFRAIRAVSNISITVMAYYKG